MRNQEIESLVRDLADRVSKGLRIEDDRIEFKLQWMTDHNEAARRVAGHANQARAEWILWITGMSDSSGKFATPQPQVDPEKWWSQVESEFEGKVAPQPRILQVAIGQEIVTAILFETARPPYVVRNAAYGLPGAGPVRWEIPWREGTATKTAGRGEAIQILFPLTKLPRLDILEASFSVRDTGISIGNEKQVGVTLRQVLYLTPVDEMPITIPRHRIRTYSELNFKGGSFHDFILDNSIRGGVDSAGHFTRPGELIIDSSCTLSEKKEAQPPDGEITIACSIGFAQIPDRERSIKYVFQYLKPDVWAWRSYEAS
jgi:hypothetical protein